MEWFKHFLKEFEEFAVKGNVFQLAIGVVIGAAFNQVTTSLVNNIITPLLGALAGGFDFSKLAVTLWGNATIAYGLFIEAVLNFLIISLALFSVVKVLNRLHRRHEEREAQKPAPPAESEELKVLKEIRDDLRKKRPA